MHLQKAVIMVIMEIKKGNHRHGCIYQKHVCIDDRHESSDVQQEEIISSSPGLLQQQLYLNRIPAGGNP
jgi:hypothetical protein